MMNKNDPDLELMRAAGDRMVQVRASRIVGCLEALMIYKEAASATDDIRVVEADEKARAILTAASLV